MTHRFVATTYNLWADTRWPERSEPLRAYLELTRPDVLCVQELRPALRDLVDTALPGHGRVDDEFEGWQHEGNIWWSTAIFELLEHGAEDLGLRSPLRRMFWVRLRHLASGSTLLVATAHYTWQGNPRERTEGTSPRIAESLASIEALGRVAAAEEPLLFMGDLNDATNAIRNLREAGLVDSFTACGAPLQPTHPARPTASGNPQVLDWQLHRGPIRCMNSHVGEYFLGDIAPSDHKPVVATYALEEHPVEAGRGVATS
jgi:endonuclease/exonuclease/phosphatase family metal-dependent hydrolase